MSLCMWRSIACCVSLGGLQIPIKANSRHSLQPNACIRSHHHSNAEKAMRLVETTSTSTSPETSSMNFQSSVQYKQAHPGPYQEELQGTLKRAKPGSLGSEDSRGGSPTNVPGEDATDNLDHLTPEEKAARTKNKNREAQKRFREKAKQRLDNLKIEAEQLEASLVRVTAEKQVLELETRGLEQQVDNTIFSQSSLLPRLKLEEPAFVPSEGWSSFNPTSKSGIILKALFDQPRKLTHDQAQKLTLRDYCNIVRELTLKAGQLLVMNPEEDPNSLAGRKLKELMWERHGLYTYVAAWVPTVIHELGSVNLTCPEENNHKPDHGFYRNVLRKLGLSERQMQALCKTFRDYNDITADLLAEREKLQASILAIPHPDSKDVVGSPGVFYNRVRWHRQLNALQDNIDNEHITQCLFWGSIFNTPHSLTIFQSARLLVECFPYAPDMFTILEMLEHDLSKVGTAAPLATSANTVAISKDPAMQSQGYVPMSEKLIHAVMRSKLILHMPNAPVKMLGV